MTQQHKPSAFSVCIRQRVRSSSAKRHAKRSAKTQIRSKTRLKSELDLATEIWSKNILRPNLGLSKVLRPDLSQETCYDRTEAELGSDLLGNPNDKR